MVRYVDTAADKTDQNCVAAGHTATEHVRQQDGVAAERTLKTRAAAGHMATEHGR
jgi:hypothetical protein